jgi:hypothetical protein
LVASRENRTRTAPLPDFSFLGQLAAADGNFS